MTSLPRPAVFASLSNRNYRRFWIGRAVSLTGTRMQWVALLWLALTSTGSSVVVGWVLALEGLPILLLSAPAGVVISRIGALPVTIAMQMTMSVHAALLAAVALTSTPPPEALYAFALVLGICLTFELPATRLLVSELVAEDGLNNAYALTAFTANAVEVIGASTAGLLIAAVGEGACFAINAGTFLVELLALLTLDRTALTPAPKLERARGQLRQGVQAAAENSAIAAPLAMTAIVRTLGFQFPVYLPALAEHALRSGPLGRGWMGAALGTGAVIGVLCIAGLRPFGLSGLTWTAAAASLLMLLTALTPTLWTALLALIFLGAATAIFFQIVLTAVQLAAPRELRGRVTGLHTAANGLNMIGAPLLGWTIAATGARAGLMVGAGAYLAAAAVGLLTLRRTRPRLQPAATPRRR